MNVIWLLHLVNKCDIYKVEKDWQKGRLWSPALDEEDLILMFSFLLHLYYCLLQPDVALSVNVSSLPFSLAQQFLFLRLQ